MNIKVELRRHSESSKQCYVWVTFYISRKKVNFSTKVQVEPKNWNATAHKVKQSDPQSDDKNLVIEHILSRINDVMVKFRLRNRTPTREAFLRAYNRRDDYETFHEYAQEKLKILRPTMQEGTYANHLQTLKKVKDYAPGLELDEIDGAWLDAYFAHLRKIGNNANTAYKNMTNLKKYVLLAWKEGFIDTNPFDGWKIRKTTSSCVYLTEDELSALVELYKSGELEYKYHKTLEFFLFLCFSSLHVGDATALRLEQFTDDRFTYYRKKLKSKKPEPIVVPVSEPLRSLLINICGPRRNGPVFENPYSEQAMNRNMKDIARELGIDKSISLKTGRHTFATIYLRRTKDIASLKEILGHSDLHETLIYAHVLDESKQEGIQCFNEFDL